MKKVILYIAQSLDGFIARENGDVSWLEAFNSKDLGINNFLDSIDTTIQGNTTFKGFGTACSGKNNYVFTREDNPKEVEGVTFVKGSTKKFIESLNKNKHKNIWLVGGSNLVTNFLNENQVDELILYVMPILLTKGIPLFNNLNKELKLTLINKKSYKNGVAKLHYKIEK